MMRIVKQQSLWRLAAIGVVMGCGLLHPYLWPLTALGVFGALQELVVPRTVRKAFLAGWLIGTAKSLVALLWFWSVYPLTWMGFEPGIGQLLIIGLYWLPAGLVLGLGFAGFFALYAHFRPLYERISFLAVPLLWLGGELLGALIFSVVTLGEGSGLTIGFSFGWVGYALAHHEFLVQFARLGGVFILTPLLVLLVMVIRRYGHAPYMLPALVLIIAFGYINPLRAPVSFTPQQHSIAFFETRFAALSKKEGAEFEKRLGEYQSMVRSALGAGAHYVVLPEDARFSTAFSEAMELRFFLDRFAASPVLIIDSTRLDTESVSTFQAIVHDSQSQRPFVFEKQYLVPQGEYTPYLYRGLSTLVSQFTDIDARLKDIRFVPGIPQNEVLQTTNVPPVLFCFESVTPLGVRAIMAGREKVPFVAHIVSHAWFQREPAIFWHQLDAMLKVQAVWNQVPIVQSANETHAKIYLPDGSIYKPLPHTTTEDWDMFVVTI